MTDLELEGAIMDAARLGMYQHAGEIRPFARWLAEREPRAVVEIGAWRGGTALLWGRIASGPVISIDLPMGPFGGADAHLDEVQCRQRNDLLARQSPAFTGILGDSHDPATRERAVEALGGVLADLVLIDGDHSYDGVRLDFELYRELVAPGGWVAFHDIIDCERHRRDGVEVKRLWDEIDGEKRTWIVPDGGWGGIGAVRRPDEGWR